MFINIPLKPLLKKNTPINLVMSTQKKFDYNPIIGSSIGIPLNILQYIYTTTYYGENVINLELILLQFAIGIFTYGTDRLYDAIEYNNSELKNNTDIFSIEKINYYENVLYNYNYNIIYIISSYIYILYILLPHINTYPLLIALTSTLDYRNFKKKFGNLKSIYIGIFWTLGCVILPCILISDDYSILTEPNIYLPSLFSMFASSNLLDIKDIDEDKNENINTIPVLYGENNAIIISHSALFISMFIFFQNENFYNNYFLSALYELQIFSSFFLNYKKNNKL
jgi:hypothetical protein